MLSSPNAGQADNYHHECNPENLYEGPQAFYSRLPICKAPHAAPYACVSKLAQPRTRQLRPKTSVSQAFLNTPVGSAAVTAGRKSAIWSAKTCCAYRSMGLRPASNVVLLWPAVAMFVHFALIAELFSVRKRTGF